MPDITDEDPNDWLVKATLDFLSEDQWKSLIREFRERAIKHGRTVGRDRPVRPERSNWRDEDLSRRHREVWGFDCPMVDIDFVVAEYNRSKAVAIIEYKIDKGVQEPNRKSPSYEVLSGLATAAGIPFFDVLYSHASAADWWFRVTAINDIAKQGWTLPGDVMNELEFVTFLYQLRGMAPDLETLRKLES